MSDTVNTKEVRRTLKELLESQYGLFRFEKQSTSEDSKPRDRSRSPGHQKQSFGEWLWNIQIMNNAWQQESDNSKSSQM